MSVKKYSLYARHFWKILHNLGKKDQNIININNVSIMVENTLHTGWTTSVLQSKKHPLIYGRAKLSSKYSLLKGNCFWLQN